MTATDLKQQVKKILRWGCGAASPLFSSRSRMEPDRARAVLEEVWKQPDTSVRAANACGEITCDLQIVVPAYNVEAYLEECMDSILSQKSKYSYHVVLVDDGAKDSTPQICDRYGDHPLVTVIHQRNRGLSGARNRGMETLFGRYVLFVDSDDLLCEGAVEGLLDTAYASGADLVEGGALYLIDGERSVMHRYDRDAAVTDPYDRLHGHAWGKLFSRELLADCCFPEGYWYEDSLISFLLFGKAKKIFVSARTAYAYRINREGIVKSSRGKPRAVETYWITELLLRQRQEAGLPLDRDFFRFLLLQIRLNQLRLSDLDREVQEAAFVLSAGLLEECYPDMVPAGADGNLIRAMKKRDFGMFRMCCRFF